MGRVTVVLEDEATRLPFHQLLGDVIEAAGGSRTDCMRYDQGAGWVRATHYRLDLQVTVMIEGAQVPAEVTG